MAGAVAIRSYAVSRINNPLPAHGNYNVCNNTYCHVYNDLITPHTNATIAANNTANYILVTGSGSVPLTEFASETNDMGPYTSCTGGGNEFRGACGNGYFQKIVNGPGLPNPHGCNNGGGCYPTTGPDPLCVGKPMNGHPRGMCQMGTARWATGYTVPSPNNIGSPNGYPNKSWTQLLTYYYPYLTLTTCAAPASCASPTGLYSYNINSNGASVAWNGVPNVSYYQLQWRPSYSSSWSTAYTTSSFYVLSGLATGTTYYFQVQAYCSNATSSGFAGPNYFTTAACGSPAGLYSFNTNSSSSTLAWNGVVGASYYQLQWRPSYSSSWNTAITYSPSYTLTGLIPATTYYYQVRAFCNNTTWSSFSAQNYFSTTLTGLSCPAPYSLYTSSITPSSVVIGFTAPNAVNYTYFLKPSYAATYTAYSGYNFNPVMFTGLSGGTTYNFKVKSNCSYLNSQESSVLTFTTPYYANKMTEGASIESQISIADGGNDLAIKEEANYLNEISLFPNPVKVGQEVSVSGLPYQSSLSLYTLDGKLVGEFKQLDSRILKYTIPADLPASIYMIKVVTKSGNILFKKLAIE